MDKNQSTQWNIEWIMDTAKDTYTNSKFRNNIAKLNIVWKSFKWVIFFKLKKCFKLAEESLLSFYYSSLLLMYDVLMLLKNAVRQIKILKNPDAYLEWELNLDTAIRLNGRFHFNLLSHRCILIPFGQFFPRSNCQRSVGKTLPLETRVHTRH